MEIERLTVRTILYDALKHEATSGYLHDYQDDKVRLIGEQIYHEQEVIRDVLKRNEVYRGIDLEPFYLGFLLNYRKIKELNNQSSLLKRRNQELDQLWIQEDERLRVGAGVKWEDLNEIFADLGYLPFAGFTRTREHGLHGLVLKLRGVSVSARMYGNIVLLPSYPSTIFSEAIEHLGKQDQITRQLIDPGKTDSPIALYRLVVPYKKWVLATEGVEDRTDRYRDDPNYQPTYYPGLLIPTHEEVVQWIAGPYLHRA